jgi:hypothetical protein
MIRRFHRLPSTVQFVCFLLAILLAAGAVLRELQQSVLRSQALQRARDTASMVEAVGALSASYRGMWVFYDPKDPVPLGDFLDFRSVHAETVGAAPTAAAAPVPMPNPALARQFGLPLSEGDMAAISQYGAFVRKNPSLMQRELSDEVERSPSRVKFRLTSDHFFNPRNAPNRFELAALDAMREAGSERSEYWEVHDGSLLFARRLIAAPACMGCHDTPQRAPALIRAKFGNSWGFGYQEGGTAGVISVTVPLQAAFASDMLAGFGRATWLALAVLGLVAGASVLWFMKLTGSLRRLGAHMHQVLHAPQGQPVARLELDPAEETSRNEVHRVSLGIRALQQALRLAQREGRGTQP